MSSAVSYGKCSQSCQVQSVMASAVSHVKCTQSWQLQSVVSSAVSHGKCSAVSTQYEKFRIQNNLAPVL